MSTLRTQSLRRRLVVSATAIILTAGLGGGTATATPTHTGHKAALGDIFSCKKHKYPWC